MKFKQQLEAELSRKNTDFIVHIAGNDPGHFHQLMQILLENKEPYSSRAAWVIDVICEKNIQSAKAYIPMMIRLLPKCSHNGTRRHILRILEKSNIPEDISGELIDYCFQAITDTRVPVAIKVFSMQIIANYTKKYPELKFELRSIIEDQWDKNSAGFKSRGRKILNETE